MPFLGSKHAKIAFATGALPRTPLGELTALPQNPSWIKWVLLLRGGEGREKGKGSEGREGERKRRGREGVRRRGEGELAPPFSNSWIRP